MSHPFGKVRTSQVNKTEYVRENGLPGVNSFQPESLELLDKIKALTVAEYLIVEADDEAEEIKNLHSRLHNTFRRMSAVMDLPFRICVRRNRIKNHIVIWKEPKNGAVIPGNTRTAHATSIKTH